MLKRQIVNQELEGRRDGMESDSQEECECTVMLESDGTIKWRAKKQPLRSCWFINNS